MKYKVGYVYEVSAQSKKEARLRMAQAREDGAGEALFSYVSIREVEQPGILAKAIKQVTV